MSDTAVTDLQLLARYTRDHDEDAFAELVRRHVDLVHSAALRQVRSPQLAEEVAQSAFTDLARNAAKLGSGSDASSFGSLTPWLYQVTRRTAIDVVRREARRQLREQIATEMNTMNATTADWTHIEPLLDEAMSALDDTDRTAVLLRYFENKSLRDVGVTLGTSDDAAQKRVSRAVERLREFFTKRGVTVGASGLVVVISANAVQAAPVGLAVTISTAAALAGTTLATTATVTTIKTIAMTTIIIGASLAPVFYEQLRKQKRLGDQVQALQQQQAPLAEQIQQLQRERDDATNKLVVLRDENERLNQNTKDLLRLRGEVTRLRSEHNPPIQNSELLTPEERKMSDARAFYERAMKHRMAREFEETLADLSSALELDPKHTEALFSRACLYGGNDLPTDKRSYENAVDDYTRLLQLKPTDCSGLHNRALCYEQLHRYDEAISDYTKIIEGDADFSKMVDGKDKQLALDYHYRGRAYHLYKMNYAKAIVDYTEALRLDPTIDIAHQHRAQCYEALGQPDKAQDDFAAEKARSN